MTDPFLTAAIRNNASGETRIYMERRDPQYDDGVEYLWSDGNFGCDCNRALLFARANGETDPNVACGDTAFTVLSVIADDGTVLYDGDDQP